MAESESVEAARRGIAFVAPVMGMSVLSPAAPAVASGVGDPASPVRLASSAPVPLSSGLAVPASCCRPERPERRSPTPPKVLESISGTAELPAGAAEVAGSCEAVESEGSCEAVESEALEVHGPETASGRSAEGGNELENLPRISSSAVTKVRTGGERRRVEGDRRRRRGGSGGVGGGVGRGSRRRRIALGKGRSLKQAKDAESENRGEEHEHAGKGVALMRGEKRGEERKDGEQPSLALSRAVRRRSGRLRSCTAYERSLLALDPGCAAADCAGERHRRSQQEHQLGRTRRRTAYIRRRTVAEDKRIRYVEQSDRLREREAAASRRSRKAAERQLQLARGGDSARRRAGSPQGAS